MSGSSGRSTVLPPAKTPERVLFLPGDVGERALIARLEAGDELAYRELYQAHAGRLMGLLLGMVRDRAKAEEVLQETFEAAFRKIGSFRGESRIGTWLTTIAVRRAINAMRHERLQPEPIAEPEVALPAAALDLVGRDLGRRVMVLVERMNPRKRMALLLQAEGYTVTEIAEMTGEPRGTLLARLWRARAELMAMAAEAGLLDETERRAEGET